MQVCQTNMHVLHATICTCNLHVDDRTTRFARATRNYENKQQPQQKQATSESLTHTNIFSLSRKTKKYQNRCYTFRLTFSSGRRQTSFISVPVLRFVSA